MRVSYLPLALGMLACLAAAACAKTKDAAPSAAAQVSIDGGSMALSSTAFTDGAPLPALHTCDGNGGQKEVSPPLAWTAGPDGTASYAVVFRDETIGLVHAAIYDIPGSITSLPRGIPNVSEPSAPAGSKQSLNYKKEPGYAGPCPPSGEHAYAFTVYALSVATLAGVTKDSTAAAVDAAAAKSAIAAGTLHTRYTRK